jgi:hypothetical protein
MSVKLSRRAAIGGTVAACVGVLPVMPWDAFAARVAGKCSRCTYPDGMDWIKPLLFRAMDEFCAARGLTWHAWSHLQQPSVTDVLVTGQRSGPTSWYCYEWSFDWQEPFFEGSTDYIVCAFEVRNELGYADYLELISRG